MCAVRGMLFFVCVHVVLCRCVGCVWLRGVVCVGGACGSSDSKHAVSVQGHAYVQLIGWQNTWEQAPDVPATPSPP